MAFFNPVDRKRQEQISALTEENSAMASHIATLETTKEELQRKLMDVYRKLQEQEQASLGKCFFFTFTFFFTLFLFCFFF